MNTRIARVGSAVLATAAAASIALAAGPASAETQTGWVGGTPPINGTVYLHSSTINNVPRPLASSVVYTSFGSAAPAGTLGAMARLFKQGALCAATDYFYNSAPNNTQTSAVSRDCGTGNYNSNGFVAVFNGTDYNTYVTFPTNGINYTSPTPAATTQQQSSTTSTAAGQTRGSAQGVAPGAKLPDLVEAISDAGQAGYVRGKDLDITPAAARAASRSAAATRSIPVYGSSGTSVIGTFTIKTK